MVILQKPVLAVLALAILAGPVAAAAQDKPGRSVRLKHSAGAMRAAGPQGSPQNSRGMRLDDWFSYGAPTEADVEREAPGVQLKVHDPQENDIIIIGRRRRHDFEDAAVPPDLTSPQALQAAQPVIPAMGDTCSYAHGCFDPDQVPLRTSLGNMLGLN